VRLSGKAAEGTIMAASLMLVLDQVPDSNPSKKVAVDYIAAYEDALTKCSTDWAPWYVIPSNHKWVRNGAIAGIIVQTLEKMKLSYPKPEIDFSKLKIE